MCAQFAATQAAHLRKGRILVSTLRPYPGGVNTMTRFVVQVLLKWGFEPIIAFYQPYSLSPELSVPTYKLCSGGPKLVETTAHGDCIAYGIGAWLPELEFKHYSANYHWKSLISSCDAFISVSGNVMAATPFHDCGLPYVAWVATDWEGDRRDRFQRFSAPRKLLDILINAPILSRLERNLLRFGTILALSNYTQRILNALAVEPCVRGVLPMPVDSTLFVPKPSFRVPRRIGFSGRIDDPRKNIVLLLRSLAILKQQGRGVTAVFIGGSLTAEINAAVIAYELTELVQFVPSMPAADLVSWLQTLEVFVLPSHQEGLCIAALEAMACGVPVVSTRCGGPEEFVIPGQTGVLVDHSAEAMARAIDSLVGDSVLGQRLGAGARQIVENRYNQALAENTLSAALRSTFPTLQFHQEKFP